MNNKNIISNKFDLNWSTMFSYTLLVWPFTTKVYSWIPWLFKQNVIAYNQIALSLTLRLNQPLEMSFWGNKAMNSHHYNIPVIFILFKLLVLQRSMYKYSVSNYIMMQVKFHSIRLSHGYSSDSWQQNAILNFLFYQNQLLTVVVKMSRKHFLTSLKGPVFN